MSKTFRPSTREASILSKIESSKEYARRKAIASIRDHIDPLSNALAMKLIESKLIETTNKDSLVEQIKFCLDKLSRADEFDIDYQLSPFRSLVAQPHVVSLYVTAFVLEKLLDHKDIVDIYGADEDIYICINKQVLKHLV